MILKRRAFAAILALVAAVLTSRGDAKPLALTHAPVALREDDGDVRHVGRLAFRGGIVIRSDDHRFGGLSGLLVAPDGTRLIAVTDAGDWIAARIDYDRDGWLAGVSDGRIGRLADPAGRPLRGKRRSDAESLALMEDRVLVAFEQSHRVWAYPLADFSRPFEHPPIVLLVPRRLAAAARNRGIEAMTTISGNRLLAITEGVPAGGNALRGWMRNDGAWRALRYRRSGDFRPTGATTLPGGDVLVLERRMSWLAGFASRIVRIAAGDEALAGTELARIESPLTTENFEGIAARRGPAGESLIYIVSDDNFSFLQRTLLFMFALDD